MYIILFASIGINILICLIKLHKAHGCIQKKVSILNRNKKYI